MRREELLDPKMNTPHSPEYAVLDVLRRAVSEIEVDGKISDQLKREMIGASGRFQEVWALIEKNTKTQLGKEGAQNSTTEVESKHSFDIDRDVKAFLGNIRIAIQLLESRIKPLLRMLRAFLMTISRSRTRTPWTDYSGRNKPRKRT
jgi:hypothetical protein